MNILEFIDAPVELNRCIECENAKFKEITGKGIAIYYCHVARAYITEHTLEATFHKNCFKRRKRK